LNLQVVIAYFHVYELQVPFPSSQHVFRSESEQQMTSCLHIRYANLKNMDAFFM